MNPLLVTMHGPDQINWNNLSNFEAGYLALHQIERQFPGITWGELAEVGGVGPRARAPERMGDFSDWVGRQAKNIGGGVMDLSRGAGDLVGDAFSATGEGIGDAFRMIASDGVLGNSNKAYATFADSGGVAGFWGSGALTDMFGGGEGGDENGVMKFVKDFMTNLGVAAKDKAAAASAGGSGNFNVVPWLVGAAAVVGVLLLVGRRR